MADKPRKPFDIEKGTLRTAVGAKVGEKIKGNPTLMRKVRKLARTGSPLNRKRAALFLNVFLPSSRAAKKST